MFDPMLLVTSGFGLAALLAVLAGLLSFLSPCVLPIVPPYLAYMSGLSVTDLSRDGAGAGARGRAVLAAVFFVMGLSTVFLMMGMAAAAVGRGFLAWRDTIATGSGIVVMIFGAHFLHVIRIPFLNREARVDAGDRGGSAFGAYILGLAFAFGWTPCIGPAIGMILTLSAQAESVTRGTALLAFYSAGLGLPFLLVAAFLPSLTGVLGFFRRHMDAIERIMGLLLWTIGLMMLTGGFSQFSYWLLETFPGMALIG